MRKAALYLFVLWPVLVGWTVGTVLAVRGHSSGWAPIGFFAGLLAMPAWVGFLDHRGIDRRVAVWLGLPPEPRG